MRTLLTAGQVPQLFSEVQVKGDDRPGVLRGLCGLNDQLSRCLRKSCENPAAVKPPDAASENCLPVEIAGFQLSSRFIRAIVENYRRPHSISTVAVDGSDIWARRRHCARTFGRPVSPPWPDSFGDQIADGIFDYRSNNPRSKAEAIGEVGGHIEFPSADVNLASIRLAEGNDFRIKSVNQRAEAHNVHPCGIANIKRRSSLLSFRTANSKSRIESTPVSLDLRYVPPLGIWLDPAPPKLRMKIAPSSMR